MGGHSSNESRLQGVPVVPRGVLWDACVPAGDGLAEPLWLLRKLNEQMVGTNGE